MLAKIQEMLRFFGIHRDLWKLFIEDKIKAMYQCQVVFLLHNVSNFLLHLRKAELNVVFRTCGKLISIGRILSPAGSCSVLIFTDFKLFVFYR